MRGGQAFLGCSVGQRVYVEASPDCLCIPPLEAVGVIEVPCFVLQGFCCLSLDVLMHHRNERGTSRSLDSVRARVCRTPLEVSLVRVVIKL